MNRQQRRSAERQTSQPNVGDVHRQLQPPEQVGDLTVAEANEIKALNDLVKRLKEDAEHARRAAIVADLHRVEYLRSIVAQRSLDPADLYSLNDDTGQIVRTHELVKGTAPVLEMVEEAPPEAETAAEVAN